MKINDISSVYSWLTKHLLYLITRSLWTNIPLLCVNNSLGVLIVAKFRLMWSYFPASQNCA